MGIKLYFILLMSAPIFGYSQAVPSPEENIPFLVTFGKDAKPSYGDDDNCQTFFFSIPQSFSKPFYIRIFDPEVGGKNDEIVSGENTETSFEFYGGAGCISEKDARETDPIGKFKSGNLLHSISFKSDKKYDAKWYTLGPFNPMQGELSEAYFGFVFKLICEGVSGNDGNLYKYFLSTSPTQNIAIPGGNAFTFEYTVRLNSDDKQVSHVYPFVDHSVISIKQTNFDYDGDGSIRLYSIATKDFQMIISGDNEKSESIYSIIAREKGTSLDIQLHKGNKKLSNNNIVFYITNQYGVTLPFFAVPIGGVPKYKGKLIVNPTNN